MLGFRTPAKKPPNMDKSPNAGQKEPQAGTTSVRRSIGEWETGNPDPTNPNSTPPHKPAEAGIPKPKPAARRLSTEALGSPPKLEGAKPKDRITEARECLNRIKTQIATSRNLKIEIKTVVTQAVDRLYQLVKESEFFRLQGNRNATSKEREQEVEERKGKQDSSHALAKTIEEHMRLLKENSEKIEDLKQTLKKQTYASAAAAPPRRPFPEQTALHSVVVTAKDENETGEEVLERIRNAVKAKEGGVTIEKIRKAKDRKVIVACRTQGERQKVKERLKMASELHVEEIKNKDPLVIFRDVLQYNNDEEVLRALRNQNRNIFGGLDEDQDRCEIAYKKRTRNPHTSHMVMRVSPKLWQRMVEAETMHIDLQRVRVADQSPLVQCSLCLGYGHGRRFCKETLEKCSHCGGPHMKARCADWLANLPPSCCNCVHAKQDRTDHNAFSGECVIRRKWEALARSAVAYC